MCQVSCQQMALSFRNWTQDSVRTQWLELLSLVDLVSAGCSQSMSQHSCTCFLLPARLPIAKLGLPESSTCRPPCCQLPDSKIGLPDHPLGCCITHFPSYAQLALYCVSRQVTTCINQSAFTLITYYLNCAANSYHLLQL